MINCFDRARLHTDPRAQNRDPTPVFIVGKPRSGTILAEQIIALYPAAFGAGERSAVGQAWRALSGGERPEAVPRIAALDPEVLDAPPRAISPFCARSPPAPRGSSTRCRATITSASSH